MSVKIKIKDLIKPEFYQALNNLRYNRDIKAALAWKVLPISKKIRTDVENFETIRIGVCQKYSKKGEDGKPIMIPLEDGKTQFAIEPEVKQAINEEIDALLEVEVELPDPVVKVSDIIEINLSVADLEYLVGVVLVDG